jgi:hypothetical protein
MAFVLADRVKESTTSPGTGTATLLGAATGYQSFSAGIGANNTTYYTIADQSGSNWEVGYGTVGSGGTTLARTTVLASSNSGSLVNFSSGTQDVWCDYPAKKAVYQDTNSNVSVNCLFEGFTSQAQSGTTIVLTASSVQNWVITGSGGQTIQLPNATTLPNGALFTFNNNQSSGTIVVQNNSGTTICTTQSGAFITVILLNNSSSAGSWDYHNSAPSNASWSTNTLSWSGTISGTTWNGATIGTYYGGTGLSGSSPFTAANNAIYSTSSSALTAGTLPIAAGGTGQTTASAAFNALSPITSTGDLIIGNGTNSATRLGIGSSGYVLTSNGTTATWQAAGGGASSVLQIQDYTATSGQTSFSVTYTVGLIEGVYRNGIKLGTADYTASTGTTVVLNTGAVAGDLIQIVSFTSVGAIGTGVGTISFGTTGLTPGSATNGNIVVSGTLNVANGGTGLTSVGTNGQALVSNGTSIVWGNAGPTITPTTTSGTYYIVGTTATSGSQTVSSISSTNAISYDASTGTLTAVSVVGSSDERFKQNIATIEKALEKTEALRGVSFDRNNQHEIGLIAQEVEKIIPEVVVTNENGYKAVNYGAIVGLLIEAIKELSSEVKELKLELNK